MHQMYSIERERRVTLCAAARKGKERGQSVTVRCRAEREREGTECDYALPRGKGKRGDRV